MRLSTEEVRHIALLARVGMTDDEVELMRDQLSNSAKLFSLTAELLIEVNPDWIPSKLAILLIGT